MMASMMNLITTVMGFGMSAAFIVFICTRLICGRRRRLQSRPVFEVGQRIDLEQPEHRAIGLEPVLLAAIPTVKFDTKASSSVEDAQCSICLGDYQEKDVLRIMPKCSHNFHLSCVDIWLRKQPTCPVCRLPLQDSLELNARVQTGVPEEFDHPNITSDHFRHQLLDDPEQPLQNRSYPEQLHCSHANIQEASPSGQTETRQ